MDITIKNIFGRGQDKREYYEILPNEEGINFIVSTSMFKSLENADEYVNSHLLQQHCLLKSACEQGLAERRGLAKDAKQTGYFMPSSYAAGLEYSERSILGLPFPWDGKIRVIVKGVSTLPNFRVDLVFERLNGEELFSPSLEGPLLEVSEKEQYLLDPKQWEAINAIQAHQSMLDEECSEDANITLLYVLHGCKEAGCFIELGHFDERELNKPNKTRVVIDVKDNGDAILSPHFTGFSDQDALNESLAQLEDPSRTTLRIGKKVIILGEDQLAATKEIIKNRYINKTQLRSFIQNPTAFLNGMTVELDGGYSMRVKGVTEYRHAYFGETDKSDIQWFEKILQEESEPEPTIPLGDWLSDIDDPVSLNDGEKKVGDAIASGATCVEIDGALIDISEPTKAEQAFNKRRAELEEDTHSVDGPRVKKRLVVDTVLNDEEFEFGGNDFPDKIQQILFKNELHFDGLARKPYPHQEEGIRWIVGLLAKMINVKPAESIDGALLADDMGLGKTYQALVAANEYYHLAGVHKTTKYPILVVVPLTLVKTWEEEVGKTFDSSPFRDIVLLQSSADLKRFRKKGFGVETRGELGDVNDETYVQYALKVGSSYGHERLDLPERLVITTYETLRDYQFSLCKVDWGIAVFDEAQAIKNSNTLASRAAKGLKALFKLVITGTPVENHLGDFWSLMDTARPGLLGSYQEFRKIYMLPISKASQDTVHEVRLEIGKQLRNNVGALMLRRIKEDSLEGLPEKRHVIGSPSTAMEHEQYDEDLAGHMSGDQLAAYDEAVNWIIEVKEKQDNKNYTLAALNNLRSISLHPDLYRYESLQELPNDEKGMMEFINRSCKLSSTLKILEKIRLKNEKAIIFVINKKLQSYLVECLQRLYGIKVHIINGDTKAVAKSKKNIDKTRQALKDDFEAQSGFGVIIMSPVAAGTGLTVVGANHVIHLERHWNPAKEAQASDRVYRIGQKRTVFVYFPIAHHPEMASFDINLNRLLSKKVGLKDAVVTPEEVTEDLINVFFDATKQSSTEANKLHMTVSDIGMLSDIEFEALVAVLVEKSWGVKARLTPLSGDHGVDVVTLEGNHALIQCKCYSMAKFDSVADMEEVIRGVPFYQHKLGIEFKEKWLVTSCQQISSRVKRFARSDINDVRLLNGKELSKMLTQYKVSFDEIEQKLKEDRIDGSSYKTYIK